LPYCCLLLGDLEACFFIGDLEVCVVASSTIIGSFDVLPFPSFLQPIGDLEVFLYATNRVLEATPVGIGDGDKFLFLLLVLVPATPPKIIKVNTQKIYIATI